MATPPVYDPGLYTLRRLVLICGRCHRSEVFPKAPCTSAELDEVLKNCGWDLANEHCPKCRKPATQP